MPKQNSAHEKLEVTVVDARSSESSKSSVPVRDILTDPVYGQDY